MAKDRSAYPRIDTWGEFSDKLVRYFRLPNGSKFVLKRRTSGGKRPFVRADFIIERKRFKHDDHPRGDNEKVPEVFAKIEAMLAPAYRSPVEAIGPDGVAVTKRILRTWREMPGRITEAERETAEARRITIEEIRRIAADALVDLEETADDPDETVTEAILTALVDRYGVKAVQSAISRLRL